MVGGHKQIPVTAELSGWRNHSKLHLLIVERSWNPHILQRGWRSMESHSKESASGLFREGRPRVEPLLISFPGLIRCRVAAWTA